MINVLIAAEGLSNEDSVRVLNALRNCLAVVGAVESARVRFFSRYDAGDQAVEVTHLEIAVEPTIARSQSEIVEAVSDVTKSVRRAGDLAFRFRVMTEYFPPVAPVQQ